VERHLVECQLVERQPRRLQQLVERHLVERLLVEFKNCKKTKKLQNRTKIDAEIVEKLSIFHARCRKRQRPGRSGWSWRFPETKKERKKTIFFSFFSRAEKKRALGEKWFLSFFYFFSFPEVANFTQIYLVYNARGKITIFLQFLCVLCINFLQIFFDFSYDFSTIFMQFFSTIFPTIHATNAAGFKYILGLFDLT
jgi:hypothetical protein